MTYPNICNLNPIVTCTPEILRLLSTGPSLGASISVSQGWKSGYLALGYQFQLRCVETQMSSFSFDLVLRLLKSRFHFRFQFCLRTVSVSGFQFRYKFHPKKLFYFEYGLFKCST